MTAAFAVYVVSRLTSYLRPGVRSLISTHGAEKLWSVCRFSTDPMLTFFGASRKRRDLEPRVPTNVMLPHHKWCTRLDTVWKQFGNNLETIRKQFAKKNGHISKKQVETIRKPFANVRSLSPRPHRGVRTTPTSMTSARCFSRCILTSKLSALLLASPSTLRRAAARLCRVASAASSPRNTRSLSFIS